MLRLNQLFLTLILIAYACCSTAQDTGTTRIIDIITITDFQSFTTNSFARRSIRFNSDPDLGPVWVAVNYIASPKDKSISGRTAFSIMPEGIPVPVESSFTIFQSEHMAKFDTDRFISITTGGTTKILSPDDLKSLMSKDDAHKFDGFRASSKDFLQLIQMKSFNIPSKEETDIGISINTMSNMTPISLEVVIGQGAIPSTVEEFIDKTNGSWLYRYRNILYMFAGTLFFIFFIRRILSR